MMASRASASLALHAVVLICRNHFRLIDFCCTNEDISNNDNSNTASAALLAAVLISRNHFHFIPVVVVRASLTVNNGVSIHSFCSAAYCCADRQDTTSCERLL